MHKAVLFFDYSLEEMKKFLIKLYIYKFYHIISFNVIVLI